MSITLATLDNTSEVTKYWQI